MSKLGSIEMKVPKGKAIIGVAVIGADGHILAKSNTVLFRPGEDDWIQVEFVPTNPNTNKEE